MEPEHQLADERVQAGLATVGRVAMNETTFDRFIERRN